MELQHSIGDVVVDVRHGVAHIHGEVPTARQMNRIEADLALDADVHEVRSWLHATGEPPPNEPTVTRFRR